MVTVPDDAMPADHAARLAAAGWSPAGRLGTGSHGTTWAVRRTDEIGGRAAVRHLGARVVRTGTCTERLALLRGLADPHVARVLEVVDDGADGLLVLVEEVTGPTLAALVGARGLLTPGEVVTVVAGIARALATLHGAGLVHGDVAPSNVVIDASGVPVLIDLWGAVGADGDLGTPGFASAAVLGGSVPVPADDIHALGRLGRWALGERVCAEGDPVAEVLRAACGTGPASRLTSVELEARCCAAARPEPVLLPDPAALARAELLGGARTCRAVLPTRRRPAPPRGATRALRRAEGAMRAAGVAPRGVVPRRSSPVERPSRGVHRVRGPRTATPFVRAALAMVLGVGALVLGGGGILLRSTGVPDRPVPTSAEASSHPTAGAGQAPLRDQEVSSATAAPMAQPEPGDDPVPTDPAVAARYLTTVRARLLISGDPGRLAEIDVPGSAAYEADRAIVTGLGGTVGSIDGLTCTVESTLVDDDAAVALVDVTYALSAHTRRGPDGAVIAVVPATAPQTVRLTLHRTDGGWRVSDVAAAT